MEPVERNIAMVRRLEEAFNRRDYAALREVLAERFGGHPPPPEAAPGKAGAIERIKLLLGASDDLRAEILDIVADGSWVGIRVRYTGTDSGGIFPGTEATGRRFDIEGMDMFAANDAGIFVEHYGILDLRAAMEQLDLVPSLWPTSAADEQRKPNPAEPWQFDLGDRPY